MRKLLIFVAAAALVPAMAFMTEAASSGSEKSVSSSRPSQSLNPAHVADRQLLAFGEAHPECQLWTNWQKLCSRTGPEGEPFCVSDPDWPVRPSEPFCTATTIGAQSPPATRAQRGSYGRFCRVRRDQGSEQFRGCDGTDERPFNGRRVAARLHPWCQLWVDADYRMVCQSGDLAIRDVPRCERLARRQFEAPSKLMCARRSVPRWCRTASLLGDGPQYPYVGDILPLGHIIGNATVVGTYCGERR